jgi:hypothetical protein
LVSGLDAIPISNTSLTPYRHQPTTAPSIPTAATTETPVTIATTKAATYTLVITVSAITARMDSRAATIIAEVVATIHSMTRSALCAESRAASQPVTLLRSGPSRVNASRPTPKTTTTSTLITTSSLQHMKGLTRAIATARAKTMTTLIPSTTPLPISPSSTP